MENIVAFILFCLPVPLAFGACLLAMWLDSKR
jgi:hypothetical protein